MTLKLEDTIPKVYTQVDFTSWNYNKLLELGFCYYSSNDWCPGKNFKFPLCCLIKDLPEHIHNIYFKAVPTFNDSNSGNNIGDSISSKTSMYPWLQKDIACLKLLYSSFDIVLRVLPLAHFFDMSKPSDDLHNFLFCLPFPAPTHLTRYRYLNKIMGKCFHGESYSTVECSIEQLKDANAVNLTPDVIQHEIEDIVAEYYGNKFEILFLLSQG